MSRAKRVSKTIHASRATSSYSNPYMFTGRQVDYLDSNNLKVQYNRNRYYDYYTGRWTTIDPLGVTPNPQIPNVFAVSLQYIEGMNLYEYTKSFPASFVDPFGLACKCGAIQRKPLRVDLGSFNVPVPIPFVSASGRLFVTGDMEVKTCQKCCPSGKLGSEERLQVNLTGDAHIEVVGGISRIIKIYELTVAGYLGVMQAYASPCESTEK